MRRCELPQKMKVLYKLVDKRCCTVCLSNVQYIWNDEQVSIMPMLLAKRAQTLQNLIMRIKQNKCIFFKWVAQKGLDNEKKYCKFKMMLRLLWQRKLLQNPFRQFHERNAHWPNVHLYVNTPQHKILSGSLQFSFPGNINLHKGWCYFYKKFFWTPKNNFVINGQHATCLYIEEVCTIPSNSLHRRARSFKHFRSPGNRFQIINSASLCSLAGRYDNPVPTLFLALMERLKIPAQGGNTHSR